MPSRDLSTALAVLIGIEIVLVWIGIRHGYIAQFCLAIRDTAAAALAWPVRALGRTTPEVEAPLSLWPILAPDAGPDTCTLCALPDLDHYRQTAPECVVPYGARFAHWDCAMLRPYQPTEAERLEAAHDRGSHDLALVFGCSRCVEGERAQAPVYDWFQLGLYDGPTNIAWRRTFDERCPTCGAAGLPRRGGCRTVDESGMLVERPHLAHPERTAVALENLRNAGAIDPFDWPPRLNDTLRHAVDVYTSANETRASLGLAASDPAEDHQPPDSTTKLDRDPTVPRGVTRPPLITVQQETPPPARFTPDR